MCLIWPWPPPAAVGLRFQLVSVSSSAPRGHSIKGDLRGFHYAIRGKWKCAAAREDLFNFEKSHSKRSLILLVAAVVFSLSRVFVRALT